MIDLFKEIKGLKPVDPKDLEPFVKTMREEVIPEIVRRDEERKAAYHQLRHTILK